MTQVAPAKADAAYPHPAPAYAAQAPQQAYQAGPPLAYPQAQYPAFSTQQYATPFSSHQPPPPGGQVTIITAGTSRFDRDPMTMTCPHCATNITTSTEPYIGMKVWKTCAWIILVGLLIFPPILLGFCFIPFCLPSFKDVKHTCPNCNRIIGRFEATNQL